MFIPFSASRCERCPNCGEPGLCIFSSTIKTWWGGGTLYGVCKKCADAHQARNEADEEIAESWREYHLACGHQTPVF